jgi:hypothetical protein
MIETEDIPEIPERDKRFEGAHIKYLLNNLG